MSKTLVIHPQDKSTDFLKEIYKDQKWTVLDYPYMDPYYIMCAIERHDTIIMMGHGCPDGLFSGNMNMFFGGDLVINRLFTPLLRQKLCVGIWCNADVFFKRYNLKGFYSGMIISETGEAKYCKIPSFTEEHVKVSNELFSKSIKEHITNIDSSIVDNVKSIYKDDVGDNMIIEYNRANLYYESNT